MLTNILKFDADSLIGKLIKKSKSATAEKSGGKHPAISFSGLLGISESNLAGNDANKTEKTSLFATSGKNTFFENGENHNLNPKDLLKSDILKVNSKNLSELTGTNDFNEYHVSNLNFAEKNNFEINVSDLPTKDYSSEKGGPLKHIVKKELSLLNEEIVGRGFKEYSGQNSDKADVFSDNTSSKKSPAHLIVSDKIEADIVSNRNSEILKSDGVNILKDAITPEKPTDSNEVKSAIRPDTKIPRVDIKQNFAEAVNINPKEMKSEGVNILKDAITPEKPTDSNEVKSEISPDAKIPRVDIKQNIAEAVNINPKEMKSDGVNILKDAFTPEKPTESKELKSAISPDTKIPRVDIKQKFAEAVNINPKEVKADGVNILKDAITPEKPTESKELKSAISPDTKIPRVNIKQNFAEAVNINPKEMKSDGVNILKDAFTPEKSTDSKDVKSEVRPDTIIPRVDIKQNFVEAVNINPKEAKSDGVNILKDAFTPEKPIDSKDVKSEVRPDTIIPRVNIKQNFAEAVNINPKQVKTENNISSNEAKLIDYKSDIKDIKVEIKRESVVSQTEKVILQDVKSPLKLNIETPPTDKIVNSKDIVINKPDNTELSKNDNNLPPNKDFSTKSSALNSDVLLRLNNIRFVDSLFTGKDFNPINIQPKFLNNQPIENISKGELNLQINNMKFVQNIISNGKLSEFEQNTKSTEPLKILHSDSIKTEIEETKNSAELSPKNDIPKIAKLLDNMFNTSASDNLQIEINSNNKNIQNISPINSTPKFKSETQNDKNPSNSPKIEIQESNVQYSASLIESSDSGELKASLQEDKPTFTDKITSKDDVMISNKLTELKEPVSSITSMINNNVNQPELVQNSIKKVEISPASEVKSSSLSKQSEFSNSNNGGENYTGFGNTDKNSNSNQSEEFQKKASNPFIKNLENASSRQLKSSNQTQAKPEMPSYMTFTRVKLGNMPGILSDIVSNSSGNYIGTAKLILTPKSLGTIFVEINVSEDSVKLNFKADSRETTKAIESNIANLRDKIESNGVKIENININHFTGEQKKDASAQRDRNNETGNRNKSGVFDMDKILNEKEPIDIEPKTRQRFDQGNYIEQYI